MLNVLELEEYVSKKVGKIVKFEESVPYDKSEVIDYLESLNLIESLKEKLVFNDYIAHIGTDSVTEETTILITSDYSDSPEECYIPIVITIVNDNGELLDTL